MEKTVYRASEFGLLDWYKYKPTGIIVFPLYITVEESKIQKDPTVQAYISGWLFLKEETKGLLFKKKEYHAKWRSAYIAEEGLLIQPDNLESSFEPTELPTNVNLSDFISRAIREAHLYYLEYASKKLKLY